MILAERVGITADGASLKWESVERKAPKGGLADVHQVAPLPEGAKSASIRIRRLDTKADLELRVTIP